MNKKQPQFPLSRRFLDGLPFLFRRSCAIAIVLLVVVPAAVADELWLDGRCSPLPTELLGPFVNLDDGSILAIDGGATYVSRDGGRTWSEPRPLFTENQNIQVSNERAMLRTRSGVIIAAFMNLKERNWTWKDELHDAPDAKLPTYVMRSLDKGRTWQDIQKMHDDWSGAVRDMIQTKDG